MVFLFRLIKMMQQVYDVFMEQNDGSMDGIIQEPGMNEKKREEFLAEFSVEREADTGCILRDGRNFR